MWARRVWSAATLFEAVIGCGSLNPSRLLADYLLACWPVTAGIAQRCLCSSEYVFEILICAHAQYEPNEIGAGVANRDTKPQLTLRWSLLMSADELPVLPRRRDYRVHHVLRGP